MIHTTSKIVRQIVNAALCCMALSALPLFAAEQPWTEGVLTVAQGNVVNLTQDYATNYTATASGTAVTLHGDMAVTSPHYFVYCWDGSSAVKSSTVYMDLGGASGDKGRLFLDGCNLSSLYNNGRRLQIRDYAVRSPDDAAISLSNGSTITLNAIAVMDDASSSGEYLTEVELGANCRVEVQKIITRSTKPVKVKFSGAGAKMLGWTVGGTDAAIFNMPQTECGDLLVEGGASSSVDIESWSSGNVPQRLLESQYSSSKLVFQGDCDVRLISNRNLAPIVINHANIEFRQKGDLVFAGPSGGGCATQVRVENVLPSGTGVGIVRVLSNANKPAHTLDLCGGSQKLNGLVLENGSQVVCTNGAVTLTFDGRYGRRS